MEKNCISSALSNERSIGWDWTACKWVINGISAATNSIEDFGFSLKEKGDGQERDGLIKKLQESTIPYFFQENNQNGKYYYAQLIFGFSPLVGHYNIFYRKSDDKSFFFRETTEGVTLKTVYFCDDFLLSLASYEDMEAYKHVLDEQEFAKLKGRTEEDNPFLVKCYFK